MDPPNSYKDVLYVSWDVDSTGKRLLDDICNIGAFSNDLSMQQFIMPHRNMLIPMRNRLLLSTVTIGFFRALKDTSTGKIVKTKSELFGLVDFITKLEAVGKSQGVILMCYEPRKLAPFLLIEGLKRYDLLERFKGVVKGFANCHEFIKVNCAETMVTYSLKTLAKILLNKDTKKLQRAYDRAKLIHEIVVHLSSGESSDPIKDLGSKMTPYIQSFEVVENELLNYQSVLGRQQLLKPIFDPMMKDPKERKRALILRQHLTDACVDIEDLRQALDEEEGLKRLLQSETGNELPAKDLTDIMTVVVNFFNKPEKVDTVGEEVSPNSTSENRDKMAVKRAKRQVRKRNKGPANNPTRIEGTSNVVSGEVDAGNESNPISEIIAALSDVKVSEQGTSVSMEGETSKSPPEKDSEVPTAELPQPKVESFKREKRGKKKTVESNVES